MSGSVGDGEFGFQIAPMLDILFVLLLFFMVCAGVQKHETSLSTELPSHNAPPGDAVPMQIGIDEDGQVSIAGVPLDSPVDHELPTIVARLGGAISANPAQTVIVTPALATKHQRVMDVLNACAAAKVKNLAFGSPTN
jgi:biopolymer transport protein ExbD